MKKWYQNDIKALAKAFTDSGDLMKISQVTGTEPNLIQLYALHPQYREFEIPKAHGGWRKIETPVDELMEILRRFNLYLQAVYYLHRTRAAYGFVIHPKNDPNPKNILENARQHLGSRFMLKIDLKDFFHQITKQRIFKLFKGDIFNFPRKTAQVLSALFTYKGRLPMGTPTSPVLSNFASIQLDNDLQQWADRHSVVYTRFADDMTFSGNARMFTKNDLLEVETICRENSFVLQTGKTLFYNAFDQKIVTGLVLNDTVDILPLFYKELNKDIIRLKHLAEASIIVQNNMRNAIFDKFKQEVQGKINFIGMVEGYGSKDFYNYNKRYKSALHPDTEQLFNRWTHFNYI